MAYNSPSAIENPEDFSPILAFGGNSTGITYASQIGFSRSIIFPNGQVETSVWGYVLLTSKGSSTGSASLRNLPAFVGGNGNYFTLDIDPILISYAAGGIPYGNFVFNTDIALLLTASSGNSPVLMNDTMFINTSGFYFRGSYLNN